MTRWLAGVGLVSALAVVATGAGCSSSAGAATEVIHIEIHHSRFVPSTVSVGDRQTVRFVVHNTDPIDHEFVVGDQATQDRHEHGVDAQHDGSVPGEISASPMRTWTV